MRNGMRGLTLLILFLALPMGANGAVRRGDNGDPVVRLTIEIDWTQARNAVQDIDLELSDGRIVEAVSVDGAAGVEPHGPGGWRLVAAEQGKARMRLDAPLSAALVVRGGSVVTRFPLAEVVEGPRRIMSPSSLELHVSRVPWDALEIKLGDGAAGGIAAPGATVPVTVGFNILTPDPGEIALRYSVLLRPIHGAEVLWRVDKALVLASDTATPAAVNLAVPMPETEGTYALEIESTWESVGAREGTRIGRLIRRRRAPGPTTMTRNLTLAVVGTTKPATATDSPAGAETVIDTVDLSRVRRGSRATATGRAPIDADGRWAIPDDATIEAARGDILRGLIPRGSSDLSTLPAGDVKGASWLAVGLKTAHPDRPHRLSLTVPAGQAGMLGVALLVPEEDDRLALDSAIVTGEGETATSATTTYSWPIWPDCAEPVLLLVNRASTALKVTKIELVECPAALAPASLAELPATTSQRSLGLAIESPADLERFAGADDPVRQSVRLAEYLAHLGAGSAVVAETLADRADRNALNGQADEDGIGPDRLEILLRIFERHGLSAMVEVRLDGRLPGLPAPDSAEALKRGLVRVNDAGKADGPEYHPLHPDVKGAIERAVLHVAGLGGNRAEVIGVVVRLGRGPTLLGGPETGLDDVTFPSFIKATLDGEAARNAPGMTLDDPKRFAARRDFVTGPGRKPWLKWRAKEIGAFYHDLAVAVKRTRPGTVLTVVTPGLEHGAAGDEARLADQTGSSPLGAWRAVGLDLDAWPAEGDGLIVLRGVDPSFDDLSHDLATHPELDAPFRHLAGRGLIVTGANVEPRRGATRTLSARSLPDGAAGDEPLGHALAVLDARWIFLSPAAVAGREDRVGRFARVFRALPSANSVAASATKLETGIAARSWSAGGKTYLGLANDTPYTIRVDTTCGPAPSAATVDDLGRGLRLAAESAGNGQRFVLDLPPFGAAAIRVSAADARAESVDPRVIDDHRSQYLAVKARLDRLAQGNGLAGPPNPGFEVQGDRVGVVAEIKTVRNDPLLPAGWNLADSARGKLEADPIKPHSGETSLRFETKTVPSSVASDIFSAPGGSTLTLRTWLRADADAAKLRIWIEGDAAGRRVTRQVEVSPKLDWSEIAVRAAELPPGGLETVRLRFEALTPGQFWIDDVTLTGQGLSESEGRARRVLMTAVQAYREGRYADFARLSGSRWVRQGLPGLSPPPLRTGRATDLPAGRRLR